MALISITCTMASQRPASSKVEDLLIEWRPLQNQISLNSYNSICSIISQKHPAVVLNRYPGQCHISSLRKLKERHHVAYKQIHMACPESHLRYFTKGVIDILLIKRTLPTVTTCLYIKFTWYYFKYWDPYDGHKSTAKYGWLLAVYQLR